MSEKRVIAQRPAVDVIVKGSLNNLDIQVRPWRMIIPEGGKLEVRLINPHLIVESIELNNEDKVDNVGVRFEVRSEVSGELTRISYAPAENFPTNIWCGYNIVLMIQGEQIKVDPEFRIQPLR